MKTLFLAFLVMLIFNVIGCATTAATPPKEETADQLKWQEQMDVILPRGGGRR
ncbi:MAG: hypothetical protein ACOZFS_14025 [Thermodesulfobacteriota bacterium]